MPQHGLRHHHKRVGPECCQIGHRLPRVAREFLRPCPLRRVDVGPSQADDPATALQRGEKADQRAILAMDDAGLAAWARCSLPELQHISRRADHRNKLEINLDAAGLRQAIMHVPHEGTGLPVLVVVHPNDVQGDVRGRGCIETALSTSRVRFAKSPDDGTQSAPASPRQSKAGATPASV
jgi:hypothetical protein